MRRLAHTLFTSPGLVLQLTLAVGMLIGPARLAYSQDTSCTDVNKLAANTCMVYTYGAHTTYGTHQYVLCNGPYSLCTTANCQSAARGSVTCACNVVQSGLSIRSWPFITGEVPDLRASSGISNFSYAQSPLTPYTCEKGKAQLVNCLNAPCTVSTTDPTASSCTCHVTTDSPGQLIFTPPGTPIPLCETLRSGAPALEATKQLDIALTVAMNCVMPQP